MKTFLIQTLTNLRDGKLKTVAGSTFQTVGTSQWKVCFTSSVFIKGTVSSGRDNDRSVCAHSHGT